MKMNSKVLTILVVLSVALSVSAQGILFACTNFCATVECALVTAEQCKAQNKIFIENGSTCGCCNVCLTKLGKF